MTQMYNLIVDFLKQKSVDSKTLTDLNNDFINSNTLFTPVNIINKVVDIIYGSISSVVGKSLNQLKKEADLNSVIDKVVNNKHCWLNQPALFVFLKIYQ